MNAMRRTISEYCSHQRWGVLANLGQGVKSCCSLQGREAFGVRGACSRFRTSSDSRKREQAPRTPNASRDSIAWPRHVGQHARWSAQGASCRRRRTTGAQPLGFRTLRHEALDGIAQWRSQVPQFCSLKAALLALLLTALHPSGAHAQLQALPDKKPQRIFAGDGRRIAVLFHNPGGSQITADLRTRLYQTTSGTAVLLSEAAWKKLEVLPGQTVLETATLTFPAIKAETRFAIQWVEGTNKLAGTTEVLVYPPDLLKDLKPLAGEEPLGVFDPQNQLKPLLKAATVEHQDLEDTGLEDYHGKLAIVGPFQSKSQFPEELGNKIKKMAAKGVAVVWMQPPPEKRQELKPSFYTVPEGKGSVVVVQADLLANLPENPQAQLSLVHFARLALHREPLHLPYLSP